MSECGRRANLLYSHWPLHVVELSAEKLKSAGSSMRKTGNSFKESNVEKGMVLPFTPLTMTFNNVHYFVDCPSVRPSYPLPLGLPFNYFNPVLQCCISITLLPACRRL